MPSGKKKIKKVRLTKEDKEKARKSAARKALVETGQHSIPTHKIHKNKKKYERKRDKQIPEDDE
ncbi:MAG: hypothetical protein ISS19_04220 [Bacteroidales bacterium]|nr:hypothetical protein [Bacteroidales bacterium]